MVPAVPANAPESASDDDVARNVDAGVARGIRICSDHAHLKAERRFVHQPPDRPGGGDSEDDADVQAIIRIAKGPPDFDERRKCKERNHADSQSGSENHCTSLGWYNPSHQSERDRRN